MSAKEAFLAKDGFRDMSYNGPMRSGVVFDSRLLLAEGYVPYQAKAVQHLGPRCAGHWSYPKQALRSNNMLVDVDTKQGHMIIPPYFISRMLEGDALVEVLREYGISPEIKPAITPRHLKETAVFHVHAIEIRLYDYGYGSATFTGVMTSLKDLSLEEFKDVAERIGSAFGSFQPLFTDTFREVTQAADPKIITFTAFAPEKGGAPWHASSLDENPGCLFWVHRLFSIACSGSSEFQKNKEACRQLVYSEKPENLKDVSIQKDVAIYPGNGNSAVVYDSSLVRFAETKALASIVRAQNVFYAAAEDMDRDLFFLSNELDRRKHSRDMTLLEEQSRVIVDYQSKIAFFRNLYDNYDNTLDPQSLKIWHALEAAWQTPDRFSGLDKKLSLIESVYDRIRDNLTRLYNKRLGAIMLAFTLISSISVIVDAINFTQEEGLQYPSTPRILVLCSTMLVIAFLAYQVSRQKD